MSALTPCNYCSLERIKRAHPGQTILLKATNDRSPDRTRGVCAACAGTGQLRHVQGWPRCAPCGGTGKTTQLSPLLPELIAVTVEGDAMPLCWMDTIPTRCAC